MQPTVDLPCLRTFREVCAQLRMSERKGRYLLADGEFPVEAITIGRTLLFRPEDVDNFISGRTP